MVNFLFGYKGSPEVTFLKGTWNPGGFPRHPWEENSTHSSTGIFSWCMASGTKVTNTLLGGGFKLGCDIGGAIMVTRGDLLTYHLGSDSEPQNLPNHRDLSNIFYVQPLPEERI